MTDQSGSHQDNPRINLTRGLFRLWVVTTFIWAIFWLWYFSACYYVSAERGWPIQCPAVNFYDGLASYVVMISWLFVPTATAFIIFYLIVPLGKELVRIFFVSMVWVVRGFRGNQQPGGGGDLLFRFLNWVAGR